MTWYEVYSGSSNLPELRLILDRTVMIRRLKSEVLTELPPKLRKIIYLKVPESKENNKALALFSRIQKLPNQMTQEDLKRAGFDDGMTKEGTYNLIYYLYI